MELDNRNAYRGLRIAVGHQARVGKDTFADRVKSICDVTVLSFAGALYEVTESIQSILGRSVKKDPVLLQKQAMLMREHYGEDVWVDKVLTVVNAVDNPDTNIIVTDLRFPNEMAALKKNGFITIKIVRSDRPIDRDPTHVSEVALSAAEFDYVITNNGTLEEYYAEIDKVLMRIIRA